MVAPHSDDTIFGLLSNSEGKYSFFLFLSPHCLSHFRAEVSGMYCMRLEWRRGVGGGAEKATSRKYLPLGQMKEGCSTGCTIPHEQCQVYVCQNANLVSLMIIFSIFDRETTQMYSQTQTLHTHTHTSCKSPLGFTEVYLISLEDLSSASLILALALGIESMQRDSCFV